MVVAGKVAIQRPDEDFRHGKAPAAFFILGNDAQVTETGALAGTGWRLVLTGQVGETVQPGRHLLDAGELTRLPGRVVLGEGGADHVAETRGGLPALGAVTVLGDMVTRLQNGRHGQNEGRSQLGVVAIIDRKSTRLDSSHVRISYAVFSLKKKTPSTS